MVRRDLRRAKTSQAVVEHLYRGIFDGRLAPGDRIDVEDIASELRVSAAPVREALLLLERDGVVTAQLHRAAFVEHFDARTLRADYHMVGLLSGIAAARAAKDRDPKTLAELTGLLQELGDSPPAEQQRWQEIATEMIRVMHRSGSTPRLRAELRGCSGFLEWAARETDRRPKEEILACRTVVVAAIAAGKQAAASRLRLADARAVAEEVIRDMVERGVIPNDGR